MGKVAERKQGDVSAHSAAPGERLSDAALARVTRAESTAARATQPSKNIEPEAELATGELVDGKYRILRVIGRGGMGIVYAALHLTLDEPVALKVLRPTMMQVPGMVPRFLREARATSRIKSEHVARIHDVATLASGVPYIVMEYLEGIELADLLRSVGPLPISHAAKYITEACHAIGEAHDLGIIHRDLKPSNLFLADRRDGARVVKVLDFGISKMYGAFEDTTQTGMTMGTPKYMSPEQMQSLRSTDGRSDVWALGAILFELLAGRPPFLGHTMAQTCVLILNDEPAPLQSLRPDVPPALVAAVARCLRKVPEERFRTTDELARALFPFCSSDSVRPRPLRPSSGSVSGAAVPKVAALHSSSFRAQGLTNRTQTSTTSPDRSPPPRVRPRRPRRGRRCPRSVSRSLGGSCRTRRRSCLSPVGLGDGRFAPRSWRSPLGSPQA